MIKTCKRLKYNPYSTTISISLIGLATLLTYALAFDNGFINLDDSIMIYQNPDIQSLSTSNIKHWFTSLHEDLYHPFTSLSLAINYHFSDIQPWIYHFTNILLHLLNSLLVWAFFRKTISARAGLWIALLFAVHPVHVESVAWASERKDTLYAFFFLMGMVQYLTYINTKKSGDYLSVLLLAALSLMSKPMAISFPLVLLCIDYLKGRNMHKMKVYLEKTPFALLSAGTLLLIYLGQNQEGIVVHGIDYSFINRMAFGAYGIAHYALHTLFPYDLSLVYPYPPQHQGMVHYSYYIYFVAPLIYLALLIYLAFFRKDRLLAFGLMFFGVNILPVLQFMATGFLLADRYIYIALAGILLCMVVLAGRLLSRIANLKFKALATGIAIVYLFYLSLSSFHRAELWGSSIELWSDVIEKQPRADIAWMNRANEYFRAEEYEKALHDYNMAIRLDPYVLHSWFNRGLIHYELGNYQQCIEDMSIALYRSNTTAAAWYIRGLARLELGDNKRACTDLQNALKLGFRDARPYIKRYCRP